MDDLRLQMQATTVVINVKQLSAQVFQGLVFGFKKVVSLNTRLNVWFMVAV